MKRYALLTLLFFISITSQAFTWKDLWWTKDQQGKAWMQQNAYKKAEEIFSNPAWKAAAAYKAGNYAEAARLYETLSSTDYYNLGNARAQLGQYEAAIKAYEQALQINADNADAQYNKKLVEALLKQQEEQKQNQPNQDQQKNDQQKQDQEKQDNQKQDQEKQDQEKQDQEKQDQEKQDQEKQDQEKQDQEKQDQEKQDQEKQDQQKQDQQKQDQEKQDQEKQDQQKQDQQKQDSSEEQQDDKGSLDDKEKKAAREQWLQLIPDDPGGLMRQKFLRDYLKRHKPSGY